MWQLLQLSMNSYLYRPKFENSDPVAIFEFSDKFLIINMQHYIKRLSMESDYKQIELKLERCQSVYSRKIYLQKLLYIMMI